MTRILRVALAAILWLAAGPALAADVKPLVNVSGQIRPVHTGETVGVAHGGTGASSASGTSLDNITGFASTGFVTRAGAGSYSFQSTTNGVTLGNLAQIGANTVLGNATGSTANVTALAVPSCSSASSALTWTSASGFGCNSITGGGGGTGGYTNLTNLFPTQVAPVFASFAWVNQGTASVSTLGTGEITMTGQLEAADNIRAMVKTAPATPYTIRAVIVPYLFGVNFQEVGLLFRESATGKLITIGAYNDTAGQFWLASKWNSPSSKSGNAAAPNAPSFYAGMPIILEISDNGTNRIIKAGLNLAKLDTIFTETRTTFLTANQVGFFTHNNNATLAAALSVVSWEEF